MAEKGWIKLHRSLQDCWIWLIDEPFDKRSAWVDLLLSANHKDVKKMFNGELIMIKRGQILTSIRKLCIRWKWSTNKVYRFLNQLDKDLMIKKESDNSRTLLSIVKYGIYQYDGDTDEYTNGNSKETQTNTQTETPSDTPSETKQECKNVKNERNNNKNNIMRFCPPTVDEVRAYCLERNNTVDAQAFVDFYSSKGWMIGKNKMKDWKAAVRTWERQTRPGETAKRGKDHQNFEGRDYDMKALEKQLLEAGG